MLICANKAHIMIIVYVDRIILYDKLKDTTMSIKSLYIPCK